MSFSLINTWSVGDKFTSAQANAIAVDLSKALDKSLAGDEMSGVITMANTAAIIASNDGNITADAADGISANATNSITSNVSAGISTTVPGGIAPSSGGTITDGGIAGGITATIAGGIVSGVDGGIALTGNTADWVTYGTARSATITEPCGAMFIQGASNWSTGFGGTNVLVSAANSGNVANLYLHRMVNGQYNGATLTSVTLYMVAASHTGVPVTPPSIDIQRLGYPGGSGPTAVSLFSTGPRPFWPSTSLGGIATPGSGTAWTNGGNLWAITFTPNQNNVINMAQYAYQILLLDEQGTGAVSGNFYYAMSFTFTGIGNSGLN
jgi:hypothetical protein